MVLRLSLDEVTEAEAVAGQAAAHHWPQMEHFSSRCVTLRERFGSASGQLSLQNPALEAPCSVSSSLLP